MAKTPPVAPPVEESLAWEAEQRPRAGIAGLLAGFLLLVAAVLDAINRQDQPAVTLTDGFRDALGQPLPDGRKGLLTETAVFLDDRVLSLVGQAVVSAVGTALIAVVLGYLFRATQARKPGVPRYAIYLALIGPILLAIAPLISRGVIAIEANSYVADGNFTTQRAHDVFAGDLIVAGQVLYAPALLFTALAFVLVSLNAMRVGLLTRFMGILGCIVGALVVFPIGGTPIIIEAFWLVSVGLLILGKAKAIPPAWSTGRAEPWPSQQQLREAKEKAKAGAPAEKPAAVETPVAVAREDGEQPPTRPHSSSKKKRKRR